MLSRLIPFTTLKKQQPQTTTSSGRLLSPLDIPELLQQIFSFLNRCSLRIAMLVCHKWLLLNQHRLRRETIWDDSWKDSKPSRTLARLLGADRLIVNNNQRIGWSHPDLLVLLRSVQLSSGFSPVASLTSAIGSLIRTVSNSRPIQGLHHPLRELVFYAGDLTEAWINQLPLPPTLTSLKIDMYHEPHIDVARILIVCPLLESLDLFGNDYLIIRGPYTDRGRGALPAHLPLRSLVLRNLRASQSWLEDLLTLTPDLDTLKLIEPGRGSVEAITEPWDWNRFRAHLQALSLPRKQLAYAPHWQQYINSPPMEVDLGVCPHTKDRTFLFYDLTAKVLAFLKDQPVFLTSLDILQPKGAQCAHDGWSVSGVLRYTALSLHQLLCESSNLRHLKTLKMPCMIDSIGVHRRLAMYPMPAPENQDQDQQKEEQKNIPGIWICRSLETLHLDLHFHDPAVEKGSHHTKSVYGYIAAVCPQLLDLCIRFPHLCMTDDRGMNNRYRPYVLEGGLCFLAKLCHLERLRIVHGIFVCKSATELNWLAPSGRTQEHRKTRRDIVDG